MEFTRKSRNFKLEGATCSASRNSALEKHSSEQSSCRQYDADQASRTRWTHFHCVVPQESYVGHVDDVVVVTTGRQRRAEPGSTLLLQVYSANSRVDEPMSSSSIQTTLRRHVTDKWAGGGGSGGLHRPCNAVLPSVILPAMCPCTLDMSRPCMCSSFGTTTP